MSWTGLECPSSRAEMEIPLITVHSTSNHPASEVGRSLPNMSTERLKFPGLPLLLMDCPHVLSWGELAARVCYSTAQRRHRGTGVGERKLEGL